MGLESKGRVGDLPVYPRSLNSSKALNFQGGIYLEPVSELGSQCALLKQPAVSLRKSVAELGLGPEHLGTSLPTRPSCVEKISPPFKTFGSETYRFGQKAQLLPALNANTHEGSHRKGLPVITPTINQSRHFAPSHCLSPAHSGDWVLWRVWGNMRYLGGENWLGIKQYEAAWLCACCFLTESHTTVAITWEVVAIPFDRKGQRFRESTHLKRGAGFKCYLQAKTEQTIYGRLDNIQHNFSFNLK